MFEELLRLVFEGLKVKPAVVKAKQQTKKIL